MNAWVFADWWLAAASLIAVASGAVAAVIGLRLRRINRRFREIEEKLQAQRAVESEIEAIHLALEQQLSERVQSLEERNAGLTQLRLALETTNQRLRRLVSVDALTGIANRRQFDRSLEREVRRARRELQPLSLVFLDLDEFKRFNDTYGHARGDEVLRTVAQTLNETFRRGGDFVARYGGEEFAVVLPGVDARRAALYAERLRRRIWRLNIPYPAAALGRVTISGGVATLMRDPRATPHDLLDAADKALYRAKCLGKNQIASAHLETARQSDLDRAAS